MKKASVGLVSILLGAVFLILIVAYIFLPTIKNITAATETHQTLEVGTPKLENATATLTNNDHLVSSSLSIAGLTLTNNYTVSYTTGIISFKNNTKLKNYTATYQYYSGAYENFSTSERTLFAISSLIAIIGVVMYVANGFGLV